MSMTSSSSMRHNVYTQSRSVRCRPSDCGIAVALPLTRDEFLRDLAPESRREFAKLYRAASGGMALSPEACWSSLYEKREALPIRAILEDAVKRGVQVVTRSGLDDIETLTRTRRVVVLAAHWRTGALASSEIVDDVGFLERLLYGDAAALRAARRCMSGGLLQAAAEAVRERAVTAPLIDEVVAAVNRSLALPATSGDAEHAVQAASPISFHVERNRTALNTACGSTIEGGGGVELEDGTHTAERVARSVHPDFRGVIDLVVCNSFIAAENIKKAHPDATVMASRDQTPPLVRLMIVRQVLLALAHEPGDYVEINLAIRRNLNRRGL